MTPKMILVLKCLFSAFFFRHKRSRAYGLEMSLAFHIVFILALMAHVAKGLPTTKQTAIERPVLRKSQPTIGEPSASRQRIILELKHWALV